MKLVLYCGAAFGQSRWVCYTGFLVAFAGILVALWMRSPPHAIDSEWLLVGALLGLLFNFFLGYVRAGYSEYSEQLFLQRSRIFSIVGISVITWSILLVGAVSEQISDTMVWPVVIATGLMVPVWFTAGVVWHRHD
jgi:membrane protein CcdC involved in cytochrome C biogenesis